MIHEVQRLSGHIADSVKYIAPNLQAKVVTPTKETIETTYDEGYNGLSTVTINPIPDEFIVPEGSVTITENGITDITDKKTVEVNVQPSLQNKTATPTKESQTIIADNTYYGLSSVSINGVTNEIDSNISAENIRKGIEILGIVGTLEEGFQAEVQNNRLVLTGKVTENGVVL